MQHIKSIGRYLFTIPFALFGIMHLLNAGQMVGLVPTWLPGGVFWVYLTGIALVAAAASFVTQKHIYLAGLLTAALMVVFVLTIHLPGLIGGNMMSMSGLLKDLGLAGGALLLAANYQDDE